MSFSDVRANMFQPSVHTSMRYTTIQIVHHFLYIPVIFECCTGPVPTGPERCRDSSICGSLCHLVPLNLCSQPMVPSSTRSIPAARTDLESLPSQPSALPSG